MPTWRKVLFISILLVLLVVALVFWGTLAGGLAVILLVQSVQVFLFNRYASGDLAKTFQEDGKHVDGWR